MGILGQDQKWDQEMVHFHGLRQQGEGAGVVRETRESRGLYGRLMFVTRQLELQCFPGHYMSAYLTIGLLWRLQNCGNLASEAETRPVRRIPVSDAEEIASERVIDRPN